MKKIILLLAVFVMPIFSFAYDVEIDGIYYNLIKSQYAEITNNGYNNSYSGDVDIPDYFIYDGTKYEVKTIAESCFYNCYNLNSVTIPNTITYIDKFAFYGCKQLKTISVPNSVTYIGDGAFKLCSNLISIILPNNISKIENQTFWGCENIESIIIPKSITHIGEGAFGECRGLNDIIIPDGVISIDNGAFTNCAKFESITIPNSVTFLGSGIFYGCKKLTSVTLPNTITTLKNKFFYGCESLKYFKIPNNITIIEEYAFYGCKNLETINLHNDILSISKNVFENCSKLNSITIPNKVIYIMPSTFKNCTNLKNVNFNNNVSEIRSNAFDGCSSLNSIIIPKNTRMIYPYSFAECSNLETVYINDLIEEISNNAFNNCKKLKEVYCYSEKVSYTSSSAFEGSYTEYATLYIPSNSFDFYSTTIPWSNFGKIEKITATYPEQEEKKCATPKIYYNNGKLTFDCETEGADFISEIKDTDIKKWYDAELNLSVTYNISVHATKEGFKDSEEAIATLCWIDVEPVTEGIASSVTSVSARPVLIQNNGGNIIINGVDEEIVSVYDLSGLKVGEGKSIDGTTQITTNLQKGNIAIIKIGDKAIKMQLH